MMTPSKLRCAAAALFTLLAGPLSAQDASPAKGAASDANRANLTIDAKAEGDAPAGVAVTLSFRFAVPQDVPQGVPLVVQGSILQGGTVLKNFRYPLGEERRSPLSVVMTVPAGEFDVEARLMVPLEESTPILLGKTTRHLTIAATGHPYAAPVNAGADAIVAEGAVPESTGAIHIRPPRRDVAPNLFIIDVDTKPPVKRVEFFVEGKKIEARNAPPYRAELDLGSLPKRVEIRAVGYDALGRYVDADAWVVNERETQLEVKITRTATPDGFSHFKLSLQNPKNVGIRSVALLAGNKPLASWSQPPYAIDIPAARLQGVEYVRASVMDDTGYEAADLLYLNGERYTEELEVNLVELPVSVYDANGAAVSGLEQAQFHVLEQGKPQKISSFSYASNLPLSLGVLIDHSGSMKPRMKEAKEAAVEFFKLILHGQDKAFVGGFSWDPAKLAPFATSAAALEEQVDAIGEANGGTALYDAIVTGLYRFRSLEGRKALIVVTDGEDTTSRLSYDDMLQYVRAARVPIYFIGIALGALDFSGTSKMKELAAETGGVAYFIRNVKELPATYTALEKDLRSQYLVAYYTESTKKDSKYRTVEVKVDRPGVKVRTIRGFIP
jgi:Ca-activated chloride channel family protein